MIGNDDEFNEMEEGSRGDLRGLFVSLTVQNGGNIRIFARLYTPTKHF